MPTTIMDIIGDNRIAGRASQAQRRGVVTLIELFAAIFVMAVPLITFEVVATRFGKLTGIAAAFLSAVASVLVVVAFYRWSYRCHQKELRELSEKYPDVYRVTALPTEPSSILMTEGAEIEVGDYGWEAEPIHDDGLTYLHGLTEQWRLVWYAGFRSDQIERIGPKPRSQYYLPYSWRCRGPETPPCPFPVQSHETTDLGNPERIIWPWVQGKRMA
jgi:membrane protein implicated in regulation of membrane protease activity